jgi:hypothetical protein
MCGSTGMRRHNGAGAAAEMESERIARRDWADLIGGTLLVIFGIWFALFSAEAYNFGELRRMGPGFFPAVLGVLVAVFGALLIVPALFRPNLFYCFLGVFLGTFIGVLPGIGALATISMLLPITFHLPPTTAIIMLAGIYYGATMAARPRRSC